jgi:hypothetical protein
MSEQSEQNVITDEEVAHILLSWEQVVQEGIDTDALEPPGTPSSHRFPSR